MPVDPSELDKAIDAIKRAYGDSSIRPGGDKEIVSRISTGDIMLDWATGGGVPLGRWCHFYGGYSSAKTLTCWNIIRESQQKGLLCAYYNIEKQFDKDWAASWDIEVDKLQVVEGTTIEGVGAKLETLLGSVHVHVIDSLAAAVSQDELAGGIGDWHPGIAARAWGKVLRRANERFDDNENMIILVNQTREVFGKYGGEAPTSGKFVEYQSSLSLHFRRSSWLFKDKNGVLQDEGTGSATLTGDKEPDGIEFQVRVNKSRVGPPLRTARLRLDYADGQFDPYWALAKGAAHFGLVTRAGSWYTLPDGERVQGQNGLRKALMEDKKLRTAVEDAITSSA